MKLLNYLVRKELEIGEIKVISKCFHILVNTDSKGMSSITLVDATHNFAYSASNGPISAYALVSATLGDMPEDIQWNATVVSNLTNEEVSLCTDSAASYLLDVLSNL